MKRLGGYVFAIAFLCVVGTGLPAIAQGQPFGSASNNAEPLMVIRFNQTHVMYEQALYNTLSEALQVKPSAMFDIVSVAPKGRDADAQDHFNQTASQNTQRVLATLSDIGLPQSRIKVSNVTDNVAASEVRIFVH